MTIPRRCCLQTCRRSVGGLSSWTTPARYTANEAEAMIKSALVTGAGGGLGRAVALALAARECAVVALDINGPAAEETAAEAASGLVTPLIFDLTAPGAAELAVAESLTALGGLHTRGHTSA